MSTDISVRSSEDAVGQAASILFPGGQPPEAQGVTEPACFRDLRLDQLVESILAGRGQYDLVPLFWQPLASPDAVAYRQEVLRDLEAPTLKGAVTAFATSFATVREQLGRVADFRYAVQQQDAFLRAAATYAAAVQALDGALADARPSSRALRSFSVYLHDYASGAAFGRLLAESSTVLRGLEGVTYRIHVPGGSVHVSRDVTEEDYAADVAQTFARFRQGQVKSHLAKLPDYADMNHVEAAIADLVARLYPQEFTALRAFRERHQGFVDERVRLFDREVQLYLAVLEFADRMCSAGLPMCYPQVVEGGGDISAVEAFDPALADLLVSQRMPVVRNDVRLEGDERILVVSGPNQGGKTTFARMVGQLTYLASLGLLVPGERATLPLADAILTHFERGENLEDLTGALEDDLVRMRDILDSATERSLVIVNEIFTSTSIEDAVVLSTRVLQRLIELRCRSVCVTFLDELSTLSEHIVSMVGQVDPTDPATRTFKVIRQPANGTAYAEALAEKHGLTYPSLKARLAK